MLPYVSPQGQVYCSITACGRPALEHPLLLPSPGPSAPGEDPAQHLHRFHLCLEHARDVHRFIDSLEPPLPGQPVGSWKWTVE